jgi:hypothetical protein
MSLTVHNPEGDSLGTVITPTGTTWSYNAGSLLSGVGLNGLYLEAEDLAGNITNLPVWEVTTVYANRNYLPLVAKNFSQAPDLVVQNIIVSGGTAKVVIKNQGNAAVADEFWVDLYVNPNPAPTSVNHVWHDGRSTQGIAWGVTASAFPSLQPSGVLTLTIGDAFYVSGLSNFSGPLPAGTKLYAQVDSWNSGVSYGAVRETHELSGSAYNNILGPLTTTGAMSFSAPRVNASASNEWRQANLPRRSR